MSKGRLAPWKPAKVGTNKYGTLGKYSTYVVKDRQNNGFVRNQMKKKFKSDSCYQSLYKCVMITQIFLGIAKIFKKVIPHNKTKDDQTIDDWYTKVFGITYTKIDKVIHLKYNEESEDKDTYTINNHLLDKEKNGSPLLEAMAQWNWFLHDRYDPPYRKITLAESMQRAWKNPIKVCILNLLILCHVIQLMIIIIASITKSFNRKIIPISDS